MKAPETWVIRHKKTGKVLTVPSGKSSWKKPGHAKNAWNTLTEWHVRLYELDVPMRSEYCKYRKREVYGIPKFDAQDTWVLVKLDYDSSSKLEKAEHLLKLCLGRVDGQVKEMIERYFNSDV